MHDDLNHDKLNVIWMRDILFRMKLVVDSINYTDKEKLEAISWLIKQAGKIEKE